MAKRAETSGINETLNQFFIHQLLIKTFHFQTKSYSLHKSVDTYLIEYLKQYDLFMEAAQGIYGHVTIKQLQTSANTIWPPTANNLVNELNRFILFLKNIPFSASDTDLMSIRDAILTNTNQLKYLATLV